MLLFCRQTDTDLLPCGVMGTLFWKSPPPPPLTLGGGADCEGGGGRRTCCRGVTATGAAATGDSTYKYCQI